MLIYIHNVHVQLHLDVLTVHTHVCMYIIVYMCMIRVLYAQVEIGQFEGVGCGIKANADVTVRLKLVYAITCISGHFYHRY